MACSKRTSLVWMLVPRRESNWTSETWIRNDVVSEKQIKKRRDMTFLNLLAWINNWRIWNLICSWSSCRHYFLLISVLFNQLFLFISNHQVNLFRRKMNRNVSFMEVLLIPSRRNHTSLSHYRDFFQQKVH